MTREIIDNIASGDNLGTDAHFSNTMIDKVGSSLETRRKELANTILGKKDMNEVYQTTVFEKDEHKKSTEYKKLSPKMRDAIDSIFKIMDSKPSDFLNTFEKTIKEVSKKFGVTEKELMRYFEKEMLAT